MTNDETQRKMDFILDQQAQFSFDIQELKELHKQSEKRITTIEDSLTRLASATLTLTERITEVAAVQAHQNRMIEALAASQQQLVETQTRLTETQRQLAESLDHTDQRLNALIDIVKDNMNGRH